MKLSDHQASLCGVLHVHGALSKDRAVKAANFAADGNTWNRLINGRAVGKDGDARWLTESGLSSLRRHLEKLNLVGENAQ